MNQALKDTPLTAEELRLRRFLLILAPVFALLGVAYLLQGTLADPKAEFPFVTNSAAKDGTFAVLCIVAAADIRRHMWAVSVVIGAHLLLIGSLLLSLAVGNTDDVSGSFPEVPFGIEPPRREGAPLIWLALPSPSRPRSRGAGTRRCGRASN